MSTALDSLPTATQVMQQLAEVELAKAADAARLRAREDAEKKALIDRLTRPSGVSDQEALKRVATIIQRAVKNGLTEVEVIRFPNTLCTDRGRAINNELRVRMGTDPDRPAKRDVRILESAPAGTWLQNQVPGSRFFRRHPGRHRDHPEVGITRCIEQRALARAARAYTCCSQEERRHP